MDSREFYPHELGFISHLCSSSSRILMFVLPTLCRRTLSDKFYEDIISDLACDVGFFNCQLDELSKRSPSFTDATKMPLYMEGRSMAALAWLITSVIELILFILVIRKADYRVWWRRNPKVTSKTHDIMSVIARDSTMYFAV